MGSVERSIFGRYHLVKRLASGGMGEIYLAKLKGPVGFEKLLVIKRILQHHLENQEFVDMFFAEARIAAQMTHANIVQIYEMGEIDDCYYIGMEFVHGKSLRHVLDRARSRNEAIDPVHVIDIIERVCSGMSYAHNAINMSGDAFGLIHRDLNPHNLLISYNGDVKIIDFGIAKSKISMALTEAGTIKGKAVYMSPEQGAAEKLDKRSDIFAIGICTYEALTLVNPFAKANMVLSLNAIQRDDPPPLADTNPDLAAFDRPVFKTLAKSRDDRYADCADFRQALLAIRETLPPPVQTLGEYMHELFAEEIDIERRAILETNSLSSSETGWMQGGLERKHDSKRLRLEVPVPNRATLSHGDLSHSRLPFFLVLLTIAILSGAGATAGYTFVERQRLGKARAGLAAAPPTIPAPGPEPRPAPANK